MADTKDAETVIKELRIKKEAERIARATVIDRCREEAMSDEERDQLFYRVFDEQVAKLTAEAE